MNSAYCEISIKDEIVGLYFGIIAYQRYTEIINDRLTQKVESGIVFNVSSICTVLHGAYQNNCVIKRTHEKYSFEDFYHKVENDYYTIKDLSVEVKNALKVFDESIFISQLKKDIDKAHEEIEELKKEGEKKNQLKKKELTGKKNKVLPSES